MASIDTTELISSFLLRHIRKDRIDADEDIFAAGYVNSLFALQLIAFIEKTFAIHIEDDDLDRANFCTVAAIDGFVQRKHAVAQT